MDKKDSSPLLKELAQLPWTKEVQNVWAKETSRLRDKSIFTQIPYENF